MDEEAIKTDLSESARPVVQQDMNSMLDEEAGGLVGAERCERTADREACRSGHCKRKFTTTSGEITLEIPKLRNIRFETAILER